MTGRLSFVVQTIGHLHVSYVNDMPLLLFFFKRQSINSRHWRILFTIRCLDEDV